MITAINITQNQLKISPIFKTKDYKKILGIYKFNLLTRNSKIKFYALGGINHTNLRKIKILNAVGFSGITLYKKKPAQINGPVSIKL